MKGCLCKWSRSSERTTDMFLKAVNPMETSMLTPRYNLSESTKFDMNWNLEECTMQHMGLMCDSRKTKDWNVGSPSPVQSHCVIQCADCLVRVVKRNLDGTVAEIRSSSSNADFSFDKKSHELINENREFMQEPFPEGGRTLTLSVVVTKRSRNKSTLKLSSSLNLQNKRSM